MSLKEKQLMTWLKEQGMVAVMNFQCIAGGASARRFYRFQFQQQSYILMDMSCDPNGCQRFIGVDQAFEKIGLCVPKLCCADPSRGLVCMSDLGAQSYYDILNSQNADQLYTSAMEALLCLQSAKLELPLFDRAAMMIGLNGFRDYFLGQYLNIKLQAAERQVLDRLFNLLIDNALQQPVRPMHRDYHCQNLIWQASGETGVVDFQDAKLGPITYDLVSVLRDCYIDWPADKVNPWRLFFYQQLCERGLLEGCSEAQFIRWFDLMSLKRHLKALFSFSLKFVRDKDDTYLQYVPRTLRYIYSTCENYEELGEFCEFCNTAKVFTV